MLSESAKSDVYSIKTLMVKNCFILICYLQSKDGRPLPARDRRALKQFEERLRTLRKRERRLEFIENSWWTKFCGALRPLKVNGVLQNYALSLCSTPQRDWFLWKHCSVAPGAWVLELKSSGFKLQLRCLAVWVRCITSLSFIYSCVM